MLLVSPRIAEQKFGRFREGIEGHNSNSRHKKKQFLYVAATDSLIHLHPWPSLVIPSKHFLVAPESKVGSTTEVQPFLARLGDQGWHMYLSYIIQRMSHRIHQKSLYLPTFAVPKQSTIQVGKYTSPTDIAGVCIYIYLDSEVHTNACVHILTCSIHLTTLDSSIIVIQHQWYLWPRHWTYRWKVPPRKLTYHPKNGILKMICLFPFGGIC